MSDSFKKARGLLGGKYVPVAVMDGLEAKASMFKEDDLGEHNANEITEMDEVVKRKIEIFETEDLPPAKKTGGVISSCNGYMKVADDNLENEDNENVEQADTVEIEKNQKKEKEDSCRILGKNCAVKS